MTFIKRERAGCTELMNGRFAKLST